MTALIQHFKLKDAWELNNSNQSHFTWNDGKIFSRLDYFLVSEDTIQDIKQVIIKTVISEKKRRQNYGS